MKKLLFAKGTAYVLVFAFSLFIVACLKEQNSTVSKAKLSNAEWIKLAKAQNPSPSIKITTVNSSTQLSHNNCSSTDNDELDCETREVEMIVQIPALDILPACDAVTVNFRVTRCVDPISGRIYLDYDSFEYKTCQSVMAQLYQDQRYPHIDPLQAGVLEERYTYLVSAIAEFLYSKKEVEALASGTILEANFYTDLCYSATIAEINGEYYAFEKTVCGSACCRREREYRSFGPNVPPAISAPKFYRVGECDSDPVDPSLGTLGSFAKCDRGCGPGE